jgi:hypothetical protein
MMAIALFPIWWSVTRKVGFISYAGAGLGCLSFGAASRHRSRAGVARFAGIVSLIEFLLALDMAFEWRISLHNFWGDMFMKYNLYGRRHTLQLELLSALGCTFMFIVSYAFRRLRSRKGFLLAVVALSGSCTLWLMEIISLHETDSALYHLVNGVMVIAFLWVVACSLTLLGVGIEVQSAARES